MDAPFFESTDLVFENADLGCPLLISLQGISVERHNSRNRLFVTDAGVRLPLNYSF